MNFDSELERELSEIRQKNLYRIVRPWQGPQQVHLKVPGTEQTVVNFSSNDYLGLANDPVLINAMVEATQRFGVGSGASRLLSGSISAHHQLEEALAEFKGTEAALTFSSGYSAALGILPRILRRGDIVILDKLCHACLIDGAKASDATVRVFPHNNLDQLEDVLKWSRSHGSSGSSPARILIVTESVYSMDGDLAPLADIVRLKNQYGAWLMVDEAHATGLFGEKKSGLIEAFGLCGQVEIQLGTLGKSLGTAGGFITGSRTLIDWLINRARTFIFSTAPSPAIAATSCAVLRWLKSDEGELRRKLLWARVDDLKEAILGAAWSLPPIQSAICPILIGLETDALRVADHLHANNICVPAIRYPTVARGKARLRVTANATHSRDDIRRLGAAMLDARRSLPIALATADNS